MRQGGLILAAGRVCDRRKKNRGKKDTKKSTAARRPRPPRDGARRNTFHALAHIRRFRRSRVRGNRSRIYLAISTSREVNEARWPHTFSRPRALEENTHTYTQKKSCRTPKHTTKSTAARRPRQPRDGMRQNTSHALAHTRPLP